MALSTIWFAEDPIDFEHKQYKLLAYLQDVRNDFKANRLDRYLNDVRYHTKNIECFMTTRNFLEMKDRMATPPQTEQFKKVTSYPDDDKRTLELLRIARWASKKLNKALNEGVAIWRSIEADLNVFYIGEERERHDGILIIQYVGSPVVELFKFDYKTRTKEVTFKSAGYMESVLKNYADVVDKLTEENNGKPIMFLGVSSTRAYSTKEAVLPILKQLMVTKIFAKNITL